MNEEELRIMNFYLTSGTPDFLLKLLTKYPEEKLILLAGPDKAVMLHETEGKTIFSMPQKYEVADCHGDLTQKGFYVIYHLSLEGSQSELLRQQFLDRNDRLKKNLGIMSYRLLMPKKRKEHVIFISQWGGDAAYEAWAASEEYAQHFATLFNVETTSVQKIFDGSSYISSYHAIKLEQ